MVMVPDAPISGFTEFSCAVCRLCEVTRNCVASRGAGDWLIQYSAPRCVKRHVHSHLPDWTYSPANASVNEQMQLIEAIGPVDRGELVLE